MRRILHIDMDAFFAAVEQKRRPELIGKPVVIGGGGDPTRRGVVSTASYEARKYGIHSAMPLRTAHKLCPQAVFLPVDYNEYRRVSERIKTILREFSAVMEDVGIDEAFLDLSGVALPSEQIGAEIKKKIREETDLTCSIGIAPNKLLAKIASDLEKPDGLTILSEKDVESRLWPLSARKLPGIGPKTEDYLKKMGVDTIGKVADLSLDQLTGMLGRSYGEYLYFASRGIDESHLVTHWEPKSISRETTFQQDIGNWQTIARNLVELVKDVVETLKQDGYRARTVTVKMRFHDFETHTRAKTLPEPTDLQDPVRRAAFDCLGRMDLKKKVRLIGVRLGNLEKIPSETREEG
jgi:DNA polymerase IV